jgi:hypothetical protein
MWWLVLGWLAASWAAPGDAPTSDPAATDILDACRAEPPSATAPFADELERAIALYRRGCHRWALDLLRALDTRHRVERVERAHALRAALYLGELELVLGRRDDARAVFESVLLFDPTATMSLLEHDPDAVDLFDRTRATLPEAALPPLEIPRFPLRDLARRPLLTYAPLGIGVRASGDRPRALAQGVLEGGLMLNMFASWYAFDRRWPYGGDVPKGDNAVRELRLAWGLRTWNYASVTAWATSWALSQAGLSRRWRAQERERLKQRWIQEQRRGLPGR